MLVERLGALTHRQLGVLGLAVGLGMGLLTAVDFRVSLLLCGLVVFGLLAVNKPQYSVPVLFTTILLEAVSRTDIGIGGIQLTLSKLAVLAMIGISAVRVVVDKEALIEWLPISGGSLAVVGSMLIGIGVAGKVGNVQVVTTVSVIMLIVLTHVLAQILSVRSLVWVVQMMVLVVLAVMLSQLGAEPVQAMAGERYSGGALDPNMWAMTLLLVTPLMLATLADNKRWIWVGAFLALAVLVPANILQSLSRAGLLATLLVGPLVVWVAWRKRWLFLIGVAAVPFVIGAFVSVDAMVDRYSTLIDPTLGEMDGSMLQRAELAETAWLLFRENWLLGIGQGSFIERAIERTNGGAHLIAHNTYLTVAAELGVYGIIAHAYFYGTAIWLGWTSYWRAPTDKLRRMIGGYGVGMLSFALMSASLNTMNFSMGFFMLGLGMVLERASHLSTEELVAANLGVAESPTSEPAAQDLAA